MLPCCGGMPARVLQILAGARACLPTGLARECCKLMEQSHWTSRVFCLTPEGAAAVILERHRRCTHAVGSRSRLDARSEQQHMYVPSGEGHFDTLLRIDPGEIVVPPPSATASGGQQDQLPLTTAPDAMATPMLHMTCRVSSYIMHFRFRDIQSTSR